MMWRAKSALGGALLVIAVGSCGYRKSCGGTRNTSSQADAEFRISDAWVVARSERDVEYLTLHGSTAYWISSGVFAASLEPREQPRVFKGVSDPHELEVDDRYVYTLAYDGFVGFPREGGPPRWFLRDRDRSYYSGLAGVDGMLYFGSDSAEMPVLWRFDKRTGNLQSTQLHLPWRNPASHLLADNSFLYAKTLQGIFRVPLNEQKDTESLYPLKGEIAQTRDFLVVRAPTHSGEPVVWGNGPLEVIRKSDRSRLAMFDDANISAFTTFGEIVYFVISDRNVVVSVDLERNKRAEMAVEGRIEAIRVGEWGMLWVRAAVSGHEIVAAARPGKE